MWCWCTALVHRVLCVWGTATIYYTLMKKYSHEQTTPAARCIPLISALMQDSIPPMSVQLKSNMHLSTVLSSNVVHPPPVVAASTFL